MDSLLVVKEACESLKIWYFLETIVFEACVSENPWFLPKLADLTMSCSLPPDDPELEEIAHTVQRHRHTKSCKKSKKSCRYGFPRLPVSKTILAEPLPESMDEEEKQVMDYVR